MLWGVRENTQVSALVGSTYLAQNSNVSVFTSYLISEVQLVDSADTFAYLELDASSSQLLVI